MTRGSVTVCAWHTSWYRSVAHELLQIHYHISSMLHATLVFGFVKMVWRLICRLIQLNLTLFSSLGLKSVSDLTFVNVPDSENCHTVRQRQLFFPGYAQLQSHDNGTITKRTVQVLLLSNRPSLIRVSLCTAVSIAALFCFLFHATSWLLIHELSASLHQKSGIPYLSVSDI